MIGDGKLSIGVDPGTLTVDWIQNETTGILPEPATFSIGVEHPETHSTG